MSIHCAPWTGCDSIRILELTVIPEVELTDTIITGDNGSGTGSIEVAPPGGPAGTIPINGVTGDTTALITGTQRR